MNKENFDYICTMCGFLFFALIAVALYSGIKGFIVKQELEERCTELFKENFRMEKEFNSFKEKHLAVLENYPEFRKDLILCLSEVRKPTPNNYEVLSKKFIKKYGFDPISYQEDIINKAVRDKREKEIQDELKNIQDNRERMLEKKGKIIKNKDGSITYCMQ